MSNKMKKGTKASYYNNLRVFLSGETGISIHYNAAGSSKDVSLTSESAIWW